MASSAAPGPAPTRTVTVPQIKTAEVPKKLQEGEEFIKWDEVSGDTRAMRGEESGAEDALAGEVGRRSPVQVPALPSPGPPRILPSRCFARFIWDWLGDRGFTPTLACVTSERQCCWVIVSIILQGLCCMSMFTWL